MAATEGRDYVIHDGKWVWSETFLARRGHCCASGCRNCPYTPRAGGDCAEVVGPVAFPIWSLVPSWTETLLWLGVRPAGRTRYCIHPNEVLDVPIIGGTKDLRFEPGAKCMYALLDRQENTIAMSERLMELGAQQWVSDVRNLAGLGAELGRLRQTLEQWGAWTRAEKWVLIETAVQQVSMRGSCSRGQPLESQSVFRRWVQRSAQPLNSDRPVLAVIWNDPLMVVSANTFIGDMLAQRGFRVWAPPDHEATGLYPKISVSDIPDGACLMLLSEPFPFAQEGRAEREIARWGLGGRPDLDIVVVDGEPLSWFGVRALSALRQDLGLKPILGPSSTEAFSI